jgi:hypothetical protein
MPLCQCRMASSKKVRRWTPQINQSINQSIDRAIYHEKKGEAKKSTAAEWNVHSRPVVVLFVGLQHVLPPGEPALRRNEPQRRIVGEQQVLSATHTHVTHRVSTHFARIMSLLRLSPTSVPDDFHKTKQRFTKLPSFLAKVHGVSFPRTHK